MSLAAYIPQLVAVHPDVPVKNIQELIAYAKARPGKLNYGSVGVGSPSHIAGELFKLKTGVDIVHVPFKGGGPAVTAALGGQIEILIVSMPAAYQHVKAGKLRPIAVASDKRSVAAPEIPTIVEQGVDCVVNSWYGALVPAKTPPAVVAKLERRDEEGAGDAGDEGEAAGTGRRGRVDDAGRVRRADEGRAEEVGVRDPRSEDHARMIFTAMTTPAAAIADIVARARAAQGAVDGWPQERVDAMVAAAGWAIVEPSRNRALAERAVLDTGLGNVADKIAKNRRKTMGLLRDLAGAKSVGVISEDRERGLIEIARPVGVVAAITPSTNPAATPANNIINALKGRNAIVVAPSPKGASTLALLLEFMHAELDARRRAARPRAGAADAGVARAHVRADAAGRPRRRHRLADERARRLFERHAGDRRGRRQRDGDRRRDRRRRRCGEEDRARRRRSTTRRAARRRTASSPSRRSPTQCSTRSRAKAACCSTPRRRRALQDEMFPDGKLAAAVIAQDAQAIAALAGLVRPDLDRARFLIVDRDRRRARASVLGREAVAGARVLSRAGLRGGDRAGRSDLLHHQGAGHSVGLHTRDPARALQLGLTLPVCRVIVNQAHCFATGGSFDNALPFSLSMGCGTWGGNSISDNLNYRHFLNITRVVHPLAPSRVPEPTEDELFGDYRRRYGA